MRKRCCRLPGLPGRIFDKVLLDLAGAEDAQSGNIWGNEVSEYHHPHLVTVKVKNKDQQQQGNNNSNDKQDVFVNNNTFYDHESVNEATTSSAVVSGETQTQTHHQQQAFYAKHKAFSRAHACVGTTDPGLNGQLPFDLIDGTHLKRFVRLVQFFTLVFTLRCWSYLSSLRLIANQPITSVGNDDASEKPNCTEAGWTTALLDESNPAGGFVLIPPPDQYLNGTLIFTVEEAGSGSGADDDNSGDGEEEPERLTEEDCNYLLGTPEPLWEEQQEPPEGGEMIESLEPTDEPIGTESVPTYVIKISESTANAILAVYVVAMICGWLLLAAVILFTIFKARSDNMLCFGMCDGTNVMAAVPMLRGLSGATLAGHVAQADEDAQVIRVIGANGGQKKNRRNRRRRGRRSNDSSDDDDDDSGRSSQDSDDAGGDGGGGTDDKALGLKLAAQIFEYQHSLLLRFRLGLSTAVATQYLHVEPEKNTDNRRAGGSGGSNSSDEDSDDDRHRLRDPDDLPPDPYAPSDYISEKRRKALTLLALCLSVANAIMTFVDWYVYLVQSDSPRFNGFFWVSFLLGFVASIAVPWYLYQRWLKRKWEFSARLEGCSPYQHLLYDYFDDDHQLKRD